MRHKPKVEVSADAQPAAMPKPAASSGPNPGAPPTPPSGSSSSWNIHPSVPIDARIFGVGVLGGAALLYSMTGDDDAKKQSPPPPGKTSEIESTTSFIEEVAPSSLPTDAPSENNEEAEVVVVISEDVASPAVQEVEKKESPAAGEESSAEEEPEIVMDSHEILGLIEDVLSKPAEQLLREDTAALAEKIKEKEKEAESEVQAAQVAITIGISDTAGQSVASDVAKASEGVRAMTPAILPQATSEPSTASPAAPAEPVEIPHVSDDLSSAAAAILGVNPRVLRLLGITADVTAAGLLQDASARGAGAGDNWEEYSYRHKQAESDAKVLAALLAESAKHVEKELAAAQAAAAAGHAEAEKARRGAAAQAERFRSVVADALRQAEKGHANQMRLQAEKLANAHMEITVRERAERQAKLDELRLKLGALERALELRSDEARGSSVAHRMAQGAFALHDALERGVPVDTAAEYLTAACGDDPLINAALRGLPRGKRVLTSTQLSSEFAAVERAAKELSMLSAGKGGVVSAAAAKLLAKLKIKEESPLASTMPGGGIDAALARVKAELVDGKLEGAAGKLEKAVQGTAAEAAVADWVAAARARAAVEQAAAVVEAHAATATASLA